MLLAPIRLKRQLAGIKKNGLADLLAAAAKRNSLPEAYLYAIGSRETNLTNELGDFRGGEYHGVGILQIDVQHPIARTARDTGTWKSEPRPLIDFGADMLGKAVVAVRADFPELPLAGHLKIAASGYNCGLQRAMQTARGMGDSDYYTTGHDYGRDVLQRMAVFQQILSTPAPAKQ